MSAVALRSLQDADLDAVFEMMRDKDAVEMAAFTPDDPDDRAAFDAHTPTIRKIVKQADSDVIEEWKYRGLPVWYQDGIVCTGGTYKDHVKMTLAKGASLDDPSGLFNATLKGNTWRAIDFHEGDKINARR